MSKILLLTIVVVISMLVLVGTLLVFVKKKRLKRKYSPFTEKALRLPGHTLRADRAENLERLGDDLYLYLIAAIGLVLSLSLLPRLISTLVCLGVVTYMAYLLVRVWRNFGNLGDLRLGLEGEEYTGQELNLLMLRGAYVFHDIPYRYGNIDHLVVGGDKVLAIETKAYRKPEALNGKGKDGTVVFDGKVLKFPDFSTDKPIEQAKRHAIFLRKAIHKKCGVEFNVLPVVALPGWYVQLESKSSDVLVINPERGGPLKSWLGEVKDKNTRDIITRYIASVARSSNATSDKFDPNVSEKYDIWLNPRVEGVSLD